MLQDDPNSSDSGGDGTPKIPVLVPLVGGKIYQGTPHQYAAEVIKQLKTVVTKAKRHKTKTAALETLYAQGAIDGLQGVLKHCVEPTVQANITLVGHGYQIDVLLDGQEAGTICRDFGGSYRVKSMAGFLGAHLFNMMRQFETDYVAAREIRNRIVGKPKKVSPP